MELIGKAPINPILFFTGKIAGYLTWLILALAYFGIDSVNRTNYSLLIYLSYIFIISGAIFTFISLITLGYSTRLGLPTKKTIFKNKGIYGISRNPMYLGFNLFTISSILFFFNIYIGIIGVYSIFIYHIIILSEEKFLENRFGQEYQQYKLSTRRYL